MSTSFVDSDGTTRFRGEIVGGGAGVVRKIAPVTVSWDDAGLYTTGISLGTVHVGETLWQLGSVGKTVFDGDSSGALTAASAGGDDLNVGGIDLVTANTPGASVVKFAQFVADMGVIAVADYEIWLKATAATPPVTVGEIDFHFWVLS